MTRHWLVILGGLFAAACCAADARSQSTSQPSTLAERMAAIGRGWTEGRSAAGPSTEQPPRASSTAAGSQLQSRAHASSDSHRGLLPHVDPRSLLPGNLFSRGGGRSTSGAANRLPQPSQRQSSSGTAVPSATQPAPIRTAANPRAGSIQAGDTIHDGFTLPGLGSPTASANRSRAQAPAAGNAGYPIIEPDGRVMISDIDDSPTETSDAAEVPAVRQSPQRRTPIEFDVRELRRELVGSYPLAGQPGSTGADVTPLVEPEEAIEPDVAEPTPARVEQPITLPAVEEVIQPRAKPDQIAPSPGLDEPTTGADSARRAAAQAFASQSQPPAVQARPVPTVPQAHSLSVAPTTGLRRPQGRTGITDAAEAEVLVTNQTALITSDIRGPKQILIGREATFRLRLHNDGDVPADELVANVRVPSWADVVDTTASQGTIQPSQDSRMPGSLQWQIERLDARASETLNLKLIPRASRPLELGVTWTCAPIGSRAVVEVQEPKLRMHVSGPDEVLFGKPQLYRLTLTNPGTGVAENVKIDLLPPGSGEDSVSTHRLGDLPPGTSQSVEVELTAREAGKLYVKALASADGGLSSDAAKEIFCRKPELEVDWRGPETKYAGTAAAYFFRVRNPGTATADDVSVVVTLPENMELTSGSEGQMFDAQHRSVTWRVGSLGPGDDYYMELKGVVHAAGVNQLRVAATTAAGDLSDSKLAETNVIALADLKLDVSDPPGPVPVGAEAIYEIRVENRGANTAEDVHVIALFSAGIEPETVQGALYSVTDGRVTFRPIEKLPAGRQIVLRIRARGTEPGNHVVRTEVLCNDLEIKLAAEETTRFYTDQYVDGGADPEDHSASLSEGFESATR